MKKKAHQTHVLSLCNHKGGVGKTTSAVNIAAGLAHRGRRVLLIDLDPQANTTQAVGLHPYTLDYSMRDIIMDVALIDEVRQAVPVPDDCGGSLYVLPSSLALVEAETKLVNEDNREFVLSSHLSENADKYDYVIIDCPPSLGLLTTNALTASTALLFPVQPHYFAVQGLQQLLEFIAYIKRRSNKNLSVGGVFLTDYSPRVKMHIDAAAAVRQAFKKEMFNPYIRHNVALVECAARGKSIFDYDPKSNGAQDYGALVDEILNRFDNK